MEETKKYAYEVQATFNGKPAGYIGTYQTKQRAQKESDSRRIHSYVKRVRVTKQRFEQLPI